MSTVKFFVPYAGEMTSEDCDALTRPAWTLYEKDIGATAAFRGDEIPPVK